MAQDALEPESRLRAVSTDDRLCAEIDRFKAEIRKLNLEAAQIEKELALPFWRRAGFIKAVVAGILALPLIWFYLDKIVIPYQNAKSELLSLKNERAQEENAKVRLELDELREDLGAKRQDLETSRQELVALKGRLQDTSDRLHAGQARVPSQAESPNKTDKRAEEQIAQMRNDLARRDRELTETMSSLDRIGEQLERPVPAPLPAASAPKEASAEPVVSAATVTLDTLRDDKDADAVVSISINTASGAVFTWKEGQGELWDHDSRKEITLNRVSALPLSLLENGTIEICLSREREHGWTFNYAGKLFVGDAQVLSFEQKENKITHGKGVSCVGSRLR